MPIIWLSLNQVLEDRYITVEINDQVAIVAFNRPNASQCHELKHVESNPPYFKILESDPQVRAITAVLVKIFVLAQIFLN
jgi:hypothetical protein